MQIHKFADYLYERMAIKNKDAFFRHLAESYNKLDEYNSSDVYAWKALNQSNYKWFNIIHKQVNLIFYSTIAVESDTININGKNFELVKLETDPYATQKQMKADYDKNKRLYISIDYSKHLYFSVTDNIVFRFIHDFLVHIKGNFEFGAGEINCYNLHIKLVPKDAAPALFTEILGQAGVAITTGTFPIQKLGIMHGYDFFNVGYYNGELIN